MLSLFILALLVSQLSNYFHLMQVRFHLASQTFPRESSCSCSWRHHWIWLQLLRIWTPWHDVWIIWISHRELGAQRQFSNPLTKCNSKYKIILCSSSFRLFHMASGAGPGNTVQNLTNVETEKLYKERTPWILQNLILPLNLYHSIIFF